MSIPSLFEQFVLQIEQLAPQVPELYEDGDIGQRIVETLNWYWLWAKPVDNEFPKLYGCYSAKADKKTAQLVRQWIDSLNQQSSTQDSAEQRHQQLYAWIQQYQGPARVVFASLTAELMAAEAPIGDWLYGDYDD